MEGSLIVRVGTAEGTIPLEGATVVVTRRQPGRRPALVALRVTDETGQTAPVTIQTPERALSGTDTGKVSWSSSDITAESEGYTRVVVENAQVFPGVTTLQEINLVPLEEFPAEWSRTEIFDVAPQEL